MGPIIYFIHSAALSGIFEPLRVYEPGFNTDKCRMHIQTYPRFNSVVSMSKIIEVTRVDNYNLLLQ